jgi:2-polyprenyl-6-methoxyphenol hydroxylase-like FAD-dependent oxidoreductase
MEQDRILVVGAGLAGLALARALRQTGFAPEVIERAAGWVDAGTGMYLPANGIRALRALDLEQAVVARAAEIPRQRLLDHRGRRLADIDLHQLWGDLGPCLASPGASCTRSSATTSRSGWAGPSGRWSGWTVRSVSPSTTATAASSTWSSALTGSAPPSGGWPDGDPVGRLGERFAGFAAPVPQLLEQLEDPAGVHVTAIEQVAAERWGRGAVALVGDAAHGMSPNMAQGAALAFEDALVLAAELRDAATVTDALAGFVARRSRRAGWVRAQTHRRDHTRNLPPILRDLICRAHLKGRGR